MFLMIILEEIVITNCDVWTEGLKEEKRMYEEGCPFDTSKFMSHIYWIDSAVSWEEQDKVTKAMRGYYAKGGKLFRIK